MVGGIGRLTYELACGLAERGHSVHVLTKSPNGQNTVDFEDDVWVHRPSGRSQRTCRLQRKRNSAQIWNRSARLLREVRRIHEMQPIDIVEGPIWDAEGLATVLDGSFVTVTSLETPLKMALETNPSWTDGSPGQREFFDQLAAAEKTMTERATAVRAISEAIAETMRNLYGVTLSPDRLSVTPIGMRDRSANKTAKRDDRFIDVLFTGRFEARKGIDVLLQVIPFCARNSSELDSYWSAKTNLSPTAAASHSISRLCIRARPSAIV